MLPHPTRVLDVFLDKASFLLTQTMVTFSEAFFGLILAILVAALFSLAMIYSNTARNFIMPPLLITQSFPKIALAPIFLSWFGFGISTKIATTTLVCFFPIIISTISGTKNVPQEINTMIKVLSSSKARRLWLIDIPYVIPSFVAGIKIAAALAAVGAIVGEFVGSDKGLGHVLIRANADLDGPLTFAVLLLILIVSSIIYGIVNIFAYFINKRFGHY